MVPPLGVALAAAAKKKAALTAVALVLAMGAARAQEGQTENTPSADYPSAEADSVRRIPRPEYDAQGIDARDLWYGIGRAFGRERVPQTAYLLPWLGSFELKPQLDIDTTYDDNIFRDENDTRDDLLVTTRPRLRIETEWLNHALNFDFGAEVGRYKDLSSEDFFDYDAAMSPKIDVTEDAAIKSRFFVRRETESRASVDDLGAATKPTRKFSWGGNLAFDYDSDVGVFRTSLDGERENYRDSGAFDNDDRDLDTIRLTQRLGYYIAQGTTVFVEPSVNRRERVQGLDRGGVDKDSEGWQSLVGLKWDVSGVSFAEIGVGWQSQNFDSPSLKSIKGLSYNGRILWNPTDVLSFDLKFSREVGETTATGQSGIRSDRVQLGVDYAPFYNLIVEAAGSYLLEDYRGDDRSDDSFGGTAGLEYFFNNYARARLRFSYDERQSNIINESFDNKQVIFTIGLRI